jgi:site-specific recombinase XerC
MDSTRYKKYSHPIWRLEVAWERWMDATASSKYADRAAGVVFNFLSAFPEKHKPEDFCITDVEDWRILRSREISARTVEYEMIALRGFFDFIISKGVLRSNPVHVARAARRCSATPRITLAELRALWNCAIQPADKRMLQEVLSCESLRLASERLHLATSTMGYKFRHLRVLAQLPPEIKLRNLRKAYLALAQRLGERAVRALLSEAGTATELPANGIGAARSVVLPSVTALAPVLALPS